MSMMLIDPYRFAVAGDTYVMGYRQDVMTWSSVDGSSGITYTRYQSSTRLGGGVAGQASAADADDGDYMEWSVNLAAGTYTLTAVYRTQNIGGIIDFNLDGTTVLTADTYSAGTVENVVSEATGITVAADGNYTLRAVINGKHASSTDFLMYVNSVTMTRTGA